MCVLLLDDGGGGYNENDYGGGFVECFYHYLPELEFSHLYFVRKK